MILAQAVQEGVVLPTWLASAIVSALVAAMAWILLLMFRLNTSSTILTGAVNELRKQVNESREDIRQMNVQHQTDRLTLARALGRLSEDTSHPTHASPHHREGL